MTTVPCFIAGLPKAELHLHIEGTLEPAMMLRLAERNRQPPPFPDVETAEKAYRFTNLQSFLDIYYRSTEVLVTEEDFYDLTLAYLEKAASQKIGHAEIFFDPQAHTVRGIAFATVLRGMEEACREAHSRLGISTRLIMCILRHLSEQEGMTMLNEAVRWKRWITGIGLDSSERGNPPSKFHNLYREARREGFFLTAHAGEEGSAASVKETLDLLHVDRIDHGVRCMDDPALVKELVRRAVPLTVCPLSNVKLQVFGSMQEHNLKAMLEKGLMVTLNSDDPAYFGGYLNDNFTAAAEALDLSFSDIIRLAANSFNASMLSIVQKKIHLLELADYARGFAPGH
ncbi:adenosine deaminase [Pelodictyon luteolum]|uniref:Adenine deaminase n=1 Tax=Chlorobium luteolum (strain DSM 273 / BCRC 81028 / 2530) TaxID=319225 RepID=ADE_CHLL3|nr:adenosine deaminase [Pelodictyon luteolum]Q3B2Q0.1 RecName: Full=Adenine deaminase; Short=ADE; AltName: Full=Adenine aminohydrolase; Short=AAH [Pelodictyon luteolum DSM 273]ABB24381.1 adenosine deaminase [Pelodictyon luteolum DSM 273]